MMSCTTVMNRRKYKKQYARKRNLTVTGGSRASQRRRAFVITRFCVIVIIPLSVVSEWKLYAKTASAARGGNGGRGDPGNIVERARSPRGPVVSV